MYLVCLFLLSSSSVEEFFRFRTVARRASPESLLDFLSSLKTKPKQKELIRKNRKNW